MAGKTLDFDKLQQGGRDPLASAISNKFQEWDSLRQAWMGDKQELRNYLFATSTRSTTNAKLPWKNSTTVPKLTQIRDNLHANYMAALFPNDHWLSWEGNRLEDNIEAKRKAIESYMRTKLRQSSAQVEVSKLVLDYIDYGMCFGTAEWVDESTTDAKGIVTRGFVGPKVVRISPYDICFNPVASSFQDSPKIIRTITTLGELTKKANKMPPESLERKELSMAIENSVSTRRNVRAAVTNGDVLKSDGFQLDGFGTLVSYYQSDYVELFTFYGDLFDINANVLLENHVITIMDRSYLVEKKPNPDWTKGPGIFLAGWRQRPDNLYAMGPLDNLVGMQYRIDHLENLKADVFDLIALPVFKIKGYVEDFKFEPGAHIMVGDDGDVIPMHPDTTALNADMQIQELERRMEELAGAPKQAMGIRTPGEKTKFEVQILDNAASRIFMNKITHFEQVFFEPLLNYMLQLSRANMSGNDVVRTLSSEVDAVIFSTVTRDDITADGILRPEGASHFAQKANTLQNLTTLLNSAIGKDPSVVVHLSGKRIAKMVEELADLQEFALYGENIRIIEQAETQQLQAQVQERTQIQSNTPPGVTEGDPATNGPVSPVA